MAGSLEQHVREVILDSIADGVFTVDEDWKITSFNRAAERITGVPRTQALGKKCFDVFQSSICQTNCALRDTIRSGRQWVDRRINVLNSQGEEIPVSISTSILRDEKGRAVGGVETFRDLSAIELLRKQVEDRYTFHDIITKSHPLRRILDILPDIAASDTTVLIEGPTGTGKELVAKAIHNLSRRAKQKYVAVNCGALPDTLLESELFGYKKGAFTDAKKDKPGRFALAKGGTLFLDEISDISPALQVKLLRVLQEKEYEPLGDTATVKADVRVIAASNQSLTERVARGAFREDLLYRLNVVKLVLPPLCERREDIPLLAHHFLRQFSAQQGKRLDGITEEAMLVLLRHSFPGNVRELQNVIEYAVVLCHSDRVQADCLPSYLGDVSPGLGGPAARPPSNPLGEAEAEIILRTLRQYEGHRGKTAAALGIDKSTLWRKIKKYALTCP
ncbi:MAG: sigma 54-interacting transcriptional regulator [Candidatus Anammoximicrobium sp.]|nr:sigma 54-interacting transcriptional regulator [Candidatus Anammoximicrobium sp.]